MSTTCNHLQLELLSTGELGAEETRVVQQHIAVCSNCAAFASRLQAQKVAFLEKHPFAHFTRAHASVKKLPWYRQLMLQVYRPAFIPVAAALLLSVTILPVVMKNMRGESDLVRFKGANSIRYIYEKEGKVLQGTSADRFGDGDIIQILYSSVKEQFMTLVSIDVKGTISFYHPDAARDTCSIAVAAGAGLTWPSSIEFDASEGYELICALFTETPLAQSQVQNWLTQAFTEQSNLSQLASVLKKRQQQLPAEFAGMLIARK